MGVDLHAIAFDHYQRYGAASAILQMLGHDASRILEVGANRQRLLGSFLPQAELLYTDIRAEGDEQDFIIADATALPFLPSAFDAVVSLDVLEHIPRELRIAAVSEMGRVATGAVVIGCPTDEEWVLQADAAANERWKELFEDDYEWLREHYEYGLVDAAEVVSTLENQGLHVVTLTQGNASLWESLMGVHFMKVKFPELEDLSEAADRLYNTRVFDGDHESQCYRTYFVGLRDGRHAQGVRDWWESRGAVDSQAKRVLEQLADGLRKIVIRTLHSEAEWAATALLAQANQRALEVATREWRATIDRLGVAEANAAEAALEWKATVETNTRLQAEIGKITREWEGSVVLFRRAQQDALAASEGWRQAVDACRQKDDDLKVATEGWQSTVDTLRLSEQKAEQAERGRQALECKLEQKVQEFANAERHWHAAIEQARAAQADADERCLQKEREHGETLAALEVARTEFANISSVLKASRDVISLKDEEIRVAMQARDASEHRRQAVEHEKHELQVRLEGELENASLALLERARQHAHSLARLKRRGLICGAVVVCVAMAAGFALRRFLAG